MWGRKDDPEEGPQPDSSQFPETRPHPTAASRDAEPAVVSGCHISKSIQIKGDISSKQAIQVDGVVEGKIELEGADLRVGQSGTVRADVSARSDRNRGCCPG